MAEIVKKMNESEFGEFISKITTNTGKKKVVEKFREVLKICIKICSLILENIPNYNFLVTVFKIRQK
jgi:hypothetical protein